MYRGLQIEDGLLDGNIKGEDGNSSIGQMVTDFMGKHSRNGVNATASVLCYEGFAYASAATTVMKLAQE